MTNDHTPVKPAGPAMPDRLDGQRIEADAMLDRRVVTRGVSWWALWGGFALLLGVIFRLVNLDDYALTPQEGQLAFQGWAVFTGEGAYGPDGVPDVRPVVQLAEAFMFFVAGATDVTARLAPTIFGIGTLGLIFLLRPVTRRSSVLGLLVTVGLSPSLVYFSRTINPAMFIVFFLMLLIVAVSRASITRSDSRLLVWCGVAGVALGGLIASGPSGISAMLAAAIAMVISAVASKNQSHPDAIGLGARRLVTAPGAVFLLLGTMLVTAFLLFTRLLSDVDAIVGILDTFEEWARIIGTRPTTTPTQFFFWATLLYELVAVVLMIVALLSGPLTASRHGEPVLRGSTFAIWFGTALVLQSLSSGREPDQFVLVSLPLTIAAGIGLGYIFERVAHYRVLSSLASLVPLSVFALLVGLIAIFMAVARSNDAGATGGAAQMEIIIILLLVIVPFSLLLSRESTQGGMHRVRWSALLVLVAILAMFGVRSASMLAFDRSDSGTELLAQDTSTEGVVAFVDQVTRLSRDLTVGEATLVDPTARYGLTISIAPDVADPYRWYFRDFPDVNITTAAGWSGSDVVIAASSESMAETGFIVRSLAHFNRVPPAYEGLGAGDILSYVTSPSKWYDGIRFLLFRETIAEPPPEQVAIGYSPELSNQINPALGPFNLSDSPGRGSALGQFDTPTGIGTTTDGEIIFVVDSTNLRVARFTSEGEFVGVWSGAEDPNLEFATAFNTGPTGLAVSEDDLVYVADTWNHRIVVIDRSGQFVREIGQRGGSVDLGDSEDPASDTGLFFGPRGVAVHDGEIYVTDTGNERVQVFASDGTFLRTFGGYGTGPGQLIEPVGIAVSDDGRIYIADSGNGRLSIFERDGTPVSQIPIPSWEAQATRVNYLAFGPDGLLYMTAPDEGVIDVFDPETNSIILTTSGPADTPLEQPIGIAVMPDGEVLVTDGAIHDVIRFMPEIQEQQGGATPEASPEASPVAATPEA